MRSAQAEQKARELADYFMRLIRRKEQEPGDDLVSRILEEHVRPGKLSREDFAEIGAMILRAGHDTTTNMIGLGTLILLGHPEQAAAVRDDAEIVPGAVEELLRYSSPVQFAPRRVAMEDVAIGDVVIRKGDGVFALNPAANRDPEAFQVRTRSTCIATRRTTSRSALESINAWARSLRAWSCRSCFRCSFSVCRTCALRRRKARSASRTICRSTACTTSRWHGEARREGRDMGVFKVRVDEDKCIGAGQCVRTAPEIFDQRDDGIVILLDATPAPALHASARKAANLCPSLAIAIEEATP